MSKDKILIAIVIILALSLGAVYGLCGDILDLKPMSAGQDDPLASKPNINQNPFNVLFEDVNGYYSKETKTITFDVGDTRTYMCDTFIMSKSDGPVTGEMSGYIRAGNTVNGFTNNGDLKLNIDLSIIDPVLKNKIITSTLQKTIKLRISNRELEGKGAHPCTSFISIINN